MAPKSRRNIIKKTQNNISTTRRRIVTRSIYKKEKLLFSQTTPKKKTVKSSSFDDDINGGDISAINKSLDGVCSTPKSEKYKIPKIESCPPAPIKPRSLFSKRRSIIFFTNPEIDNFLMFAMGDNNIEDNYSR
ncbi:cyclin-dependent protein kinase inhibitor SMR13-like isoform X1 [Amaranthus tricolor]|uniref:cyclin-dependent protein kinase inhibitor SMR13-like isoform X1 n=2 Tax=Amaranthus tricolor TaxID=29722 RepID=UPI00258370C3|nr:cyclin-dependent protein kinase inhibitor SMR13-like isoform X1 [Amaranthus tricolor]